MEYILKNNKTVIIREPVVEDAEQLINVMKTAYRETLFLSRDSDEFNITIKQEEFVISKVLENKNKVWYIAECDGKMVGQCSVEPVRNSSRYKHRGKLGFVLIEEYCNQGIGGKMMEECLKWCLAHDIKQVELDAVTNNIRAIKMYKQFGFEVIGKLPNALHYKDNTYADEYIMIKKL